MRTLDSWLEYIAEQHWQTIDMGLDRMGSMVERMNLSRPAPKVVTVAGTNGKGSTCVACEALLASQGYKTGLTLSPHLRRFNERIRIDAEQAGDELICTAFAAVEEHRQDLTLTYFEFSTLAALWCFKQAAVDVAILEIGLGGRLDAFNIIDADVAVITSIGIDHEQFLGTTRDEIGYEKAGILRSGQYVALGPDMPASVVQETSNLNLTPLTVGDDYDIAWVAASKSSPATWSIQQGDKTLAGNLPFGGCAPQNLLLAYLAVQGVSEVPVSAVRDIADTVGLPGRLQIVPRDERIWILDVAHNVDAVEFLCQQLSQRDWSPQIIVYGTLRDKDHQGIYKTVSGEEFGSSPESWRLVTTTGERGLSALDLATKLPGDIATFANFDEIIDEVNSATRPGDVILAFGSFNVIEQFEASLEQKHFSNNSISRTKALLEQEHLLSKRTQHHD